MQCKLAACWMRAKSFGSYSCHVFAILILVLSKCSFSVRKSLLLAKLQEYYWIKWNILNHKDFLIWKTEKHKPCISWSERWKKVKVTQLCQTLCDPMDSSPWKSRGQNSGVGSLSLLQEIFPTCGSNPGLLHCRWVLH